MAEAIVTADSAVRPDPIPLTFWPTYPRRPGLAAHFAPRLAV
jgi:hypothetical protein